ncbi:hypothetical protein [Pedobacter caeni]|uniref:Fasciclin domain-containing protein n=1 Tax=Pedobacter caeni TaxID=288992 RepID=A0A1M5P8L5_9SPHI|nr:hypothetical protein [Pedobacter caeni]SHG98130.1 hypothetical protein SAMN04488522_10953 [Pedobacter caeni]
MFKILKTPVLLLLPILLMLAACNKDKYFYDTGVHKAEFRGSILDYLKSKPGHFDSLVRIINIAGMNEVYAKENLTFFAPPSSLVHKSVLKLNDYLRDNGRDTVSQLEQVKPEVWREMLALYTFKGTYRLKDYPQIDTTSIIAFPGQGYRGYGNLEESQNRTMNIGVVHNDAAGVKYAGYRQLVLSYIPDMSKPSTRLNYAQVASSDIAPTNGIIHALNINCVGQVKLTSGDIASFWYPQYFGFDANSFVLLAISNGISPKK